VEADVYVWRYALLVVHDRKKDEEVLSLFQVNTDKSVHPVCHPGIMG